FIKMNLSTWTPYELFHFTNDLKWGMDNQIHSICPKVFQMVNTVLHTNQIVQRTHSPEIIRTATPTHMVNWSMTHPTWNGFITNLQSPIYHSNHSVRMQITTLMVMVVSIEL